MSGVNVQQSRALSVRLYSPAVFRLNDRCINIHLTEMALAWGKTHLTQGYMYIVYTWNQSHRWRVQMQFATAPEKAELSMCGSNNKAVIGNIRKHDWHVHKTTKSLYFKWKVPACFRIATEIEWIVPSLVVAILNSVRWPPKSDCSVEIQCDHVKYGSVLLLRRNWML